MTVKEWLLRARSIDKYIRALRSERETVYERATSATARGQSERVQEGGKNGAERLMIKYAEYGKLIDEQVDRLIRVKTEIAEAISKMDDYTLAALLLNRYIRFMTWEEIAEEMNYSYMHICRLHGKALEKIKDVIECYIT